MIRRTRLRRVMPLRLAAQALKIPVMVIGAWYIGMLAGAIVVGGPWGPPLGLVYWISVYVAAPVAASALLQWTFGGYNSLKAGIVLSLISSFAGLLFFAVVSQI